MEYKLSFKKLQDGKVHSYQSVVKALIDEGVIASHVDYVILNCLKEHILGTSLETNVSLVNRKFWYISTVKRVDLDNKFTYEDWKKEGNKYFSDGDYRSAIQCYIESIKKKPDYIDAYINLCISSIKIGDIDYANASYTRAMNINKDMTEKYLKGEFKHRYCFVCGKYLGAWFKGLEVCPECAEYKIETIK